MLDFKLEKIDSLRSTSLDLQSGQITLPVLTSISKFSKFVPHFLQLYSLIGNLLTSCCVNYDASTGQKVSCCQPRLRDGEEVSC